MPVLQSDDSCESDPKIQESKLACQDVNASIMHVWIGSQVQLYIATYGYTVLFSYIAI